MTDLDRFYHFFRTFSPIFHRFLQIWIDLDKFYRNFSSCMCSNWTFCSQLQIFWFYTLWNPNFGHFWDIISPFGPDIQEMDYLQHLKWHMTVIIPFILSLYGVAGVLIEYSAHNCRYFYFRPSETLILVILGYLFILRTQNTRNRPSPTPQMAYGS